MKRAAPLLLLAGCWVENYVTGSSASDWIEIPRVAKAAPEVLRLARDILLRQGYVLRPEAPGDLHLGTEWDVHLSSHWKEGFRTRVEVEVEAAGEGRSNVRIRSFRDFNDNAKNPADAEAPVWRGAAIEDKQKPKMGEPALRIRQLLKVKLEGTP